MEDKMKRCKFNKRITREFLANPFTEPYEERLRKSGAIDLKDNYIIEELANGYDCIIPIDENKKI
jgi:hypothetical protein